MISTVSPDVGLYTTHSVVVDPMKLINRHDKKPPLKEWRRADGIKFGGKIKGLILTDFRWVQ